MRRLIRDSVRPYFGRLGFAVIAMAIMAGATALSAWLIEPVVTDVFIS